MMNDEVAKKSRPKDLTKARLYMNQARQAAKWADVASKARLGRLGVDLHVLVPTDRRYTVQCNAVPDRPIDLHLHVHWHMESS